MSTLRWLFAPTIRVQWPELQLSGSRANQAHAARLPANRFPSGATEWSVRLALCLLIVAILASCTSLGPSTEAPPSADRARSLDRAGDYAGAARAYEALAAQNSGTEQNALLLQAATEHLRARKPDDAERVLNSIAPPLTPDQNFERQMLSVQLALARSQGQEAWRQISAVPQPGGGPGVLRYLALRQKAAFATGRAADGVRAEVARERLLTVPADRTAARSDLLADLRTAQESGVRVEPRAVTDNIVRGWLELAALSASVARSPTTSIPDVEAWRTRFPNHPASEVVTSELLGIKTETHESIPHVALLLPLSGRAAASGIAVRDGFMTALYQVPVAERPRVRLYDTAEISAAEAIARARSEGAEFIVGPLTKDEVTAAADLGDARPPILALNFLLPERPGPAGFYQFALSPEDEARQVARRVIADHRLRGVAVVPEGDWGTRVLTAFRQELEAGGGVLVDQVALDSTRNDWGPEITQVLRVSDSNARHKRLESVLGTKLEFEPRRRADLDFVFAPTPSFNTARQLRPQLRFHFAGDVPTYATSDAFEPDPNANEDMEGLMFPDMPWMLGGDLADSVRSAAREAWPTGAWRRNSRLFAYGFDAYRLSAALRAGGANGTLNVDGLTGRLTLDSERRVHRELAWAQIHNGATRPVPAAALAPAQPPPPAAAAAQ
ncbi:MAG: penicillin-binding protein activator [Gammaproteobacteria bacterium]